MAFDFGRFFNDAGNVGQNALAGGSVGAQAGALLGSVVPGVGNVIGTAVGGGLGLVGGAVKGLFDNSARNTAQDEEAAARAKANELAALQAQQAAEAAKQAADYRAGVTERFTPVLGDLSTAAAQAKLAADNSYLNRFNATNDYINGVNDSVNTVRGMQGQGVFRDLVSSMQNEANPFVNGGRVATATDARAGANFASQQNTLRSSLAQRGLLGGPGEIAAMAALSGQQGEAMFSAGLDRFLAEADFETARNQQIRDYTQAGGDRSDRMSMALAELLRDPTKLQQMNSVYQQDYGNSATARNANLAGQQAFSQAMSAGIDAGNSAGNIAAQSAGSQSALALAARAEQDRINNSAAAAYGGLRNFVDNVPTPAVEAAGGFLSQFIQPYVPQPTNYPQKAGTSIDPRTRYNAGFSANAQAGQQQQSSTYQQPSQQARPGVGGRQRGGAGLPYVNRMGQ